MRRTLPLILLALVSALARAGDRFTGPWDVAALKAVPKAE